MLLDVVARGELGSDVGLGGCFSGYCGFLHREKKCQFAQKYVPFQLESLWCVSDSRSGGHPLTPGYGIPDSMIWHPWLDGMVFHPYPIQRLSVIDPCQQRWFSDNMMIRSRPLSESSVALGSMEGDHVWCIISCLAIFWESIIKMCKTW